VGRHVGDLAELAFQLIGALQRRSTQGIGRFEHNEGLFAFGKHAFELAGGLRHRVAGHDEPVDRVSVGICVAP